MKNGFTKFLFTLFVLTLGFGQVWGADETINLYYGTSKAVDGDNLNTEDFFFSGHTSNTGKSAVEIGGTSFTHYLTMSGYGASAINTDPAKLILYYPKKSTTTFTVYVQNKYNGNKKYYIDHLFEGETVVSDRKYQKQLAKDGTEKHEYTFTNTDKKNAVIALMPSQTMYIYQITVTESGDDLKQAGDNGYSFNTYRAGALAEAEVNVDGLSIKPSSKLNVGASYFKIKQSSTYAKFTLSQKTLVTVGVYNSRKFIFCAAATPTDAEKADKKGTGSAGNVQTALAAGTWYLESESTSELQISNISFSIPTISYDANGGEGTMSSNTWTVAANGFTAPSGKKFDGWKDGDDNVYTVGQEVLEDVTLYAQWKDDVAEYTVTYKDGTTELKSVNVAVGSAPDAYSPTKEFYTFAAWQKNAADYDPADLASDAAANDEITLTARWTAQYTSGTYEFTGNLTMGTDPQMTIANSSDGNNYEAGRIDNIYVSAQKIGYEATGDYGGWKLKTTNGNLRFLVENTCGIRVTLGEANPLRIDYTEGGVAKNASIAKSTTSAVYKADANTIVTLTNTTSGNKTVTLKKIEILPLYTATRVDGKSDGAGSDPNVTETTLPTPTAISGWTFTGWTANEDVKLGDETKIAGTILAAGTYTLLANTTFTAQWIEASTTYDVTYVSAHGTAPDAENAASVVLAELSESGWAHKGWTANVDVTVDAATVTAGTLIANGKTAILASDVTFTAVWTEIFTVTYNANGGTCGTASATWTEGDEALALPTATKENYDFIGWYDAATGGNKIASPYTPTASIELFAHYMPKLVQAIYSNSFDAFIKNQAVNVYYLQGESAPTLSSIKVLGVETPVFEEVDGNIKVTIETVDYIFPVTKIAVAPYAGTGSEETFDGTETYIKTGYSYSGGWRFSKTDNDWSRETPGNTRLYFFLGAADHFTLKSTGTSRAMKVYRNGVLLDEPTASGSNPTIAGSNAPAMYAIVSNQTSGDGKFTAITTSPWVPTTAVVLREGGVAISEKEIWESTNFTLTAEVTPDNASNKTITWTTSNDAIATVDNGVVTGVAANATPVTITASTVDGVYATCAVTVTAAPTPCETPTITTHPATQAYCAGSEPTLTVEANVTDGGTLHYAWTKDDAAIGGDAATCVVDGVGTYKVVVTNHVDGKLDASVTSADAIITLNVAAAITTQPTNKRDVVSGDDVTLSVVATNATSYQWYSCDDAEKHNAAAIPGEDEADYTFACTANGYYYCVVGNACGEDLVSNVVSVKLEPVNCNTIASIPSSAPYQYVQTDEWTVYGITSAGKLDGSNRFVNNAKDFDGNTVNAISYGRVGIIFEKDIESLTLYATVGSSGRTFNSISVTSDAINVSQNPTYTEVSADLATSQLTTSSPYQYVFTADNMLLEAGKKYWLQFSGGVSIFKICYTEAPAKCEAPVLPALANKELCEGDAFTAWNATATVSDGGSLSYQWYNGDTDDALDGETNAEFTPSADGNYYVIVTNTLAAHRDNSTKSAVLNVAHFSSAVITTAPKNVRDDAGEAAVLTVVAAGSGLHYTWQESATIDGTYTDVAGAADAASLDVIVPTGVKYYKVVVSSVCGTPVEAIAKVEEWVELPQLNVSENTTWDFSTCADAEIKLTNETTPKKGEDCLMANIRGVHYDDPAFNAQAIIFTGEYIYRNVDGKPLGAITLKFTTTVDGFVTVRFADNGNNNRCLRVTDSEGVEYSQSSASNSDIQEFTAFVHAGEIEIMGMSEDQASDRQYVRIFNLAFEKVDYSRAVTSGRIGTICLPNGGVMKEGTVYEVAYYGETSQKVFFDEIIGGVMEAGVPYVFLPKEGAKYIGVEYTDAANAAATDRNGLYGFIGASADSEFNIPDGVGNYIIQNNQYREVRAGADARIISNRAYLKLGDITPTAPALAPGRKRVSIAAAPSATTGIEDIEAGEAPMKVMMNGQLYILRGEKIYDATGRLIK